MNILKRFLQIQFVRGIIGAGAGAAIALVLYGTYEAGMQTLAYLVPPGNSTSSQMSSVSDSTTTNQNIVIVGARAREIAMLSQSSQSASALSSAKQSSSIASMVSSSSSKAFAMPAIAVHASSSSKEMQVVAQTEALHSGAPSLPSSGPAAWIAAFIALLLSAVCMKKIRIALVSAAQHAIH